MARALKDRNVEIAVRYRSGEPVAEIASEFKISATRVRQIASANPSFVRSYDIESDQHIEMQMGRALALGSALRQLTKTLLDMQRQIDGMVADSVGFHGKRLPRQRTELPVLDREVVGQEAEIAFGDRE